MAKENGKFQNFLNGLNAVSGALQQQANANKTIVGYDTVYNVVSKRIAVKTEYIEDFSRCPRPKEIVVSANNPHLFTGNKPREISEIPIPSLEVSGNVEKKPIAISYWLCVDQSTKIAMTQALQRTLSLGATAYISAQTMGASSLCNKQISAITDAAAEAVVPQTAEPIKYKIVSNENSARDWRVNGGTSGLSNVRFDNAILNNWSEGQSSYWLCLFNDKLVGNKTVSFQYSIIYEVTTFENRLVKEVVKINPIYQ